MLEQDSSKPDLALWLVITMATEPIDDGLFVIARRFPVDVPNFTKSNTDLKFREAALYLQTELAHSGEECVAI